MIIQRRMCWNFMRSHIQLETIGFNLSILSDESDKSCLTQFYAKRTNISRMGRACIGEHDSANGCCGRQTEIKRNNRDHGLRSDGQQFRFFTIYSGLMLSAYFVLTNLWFFDHLVAALKKANALVIWAFAFDTVV